MRPKTGKTDGDSSPATSTERGPRGGRPMWSRLVSAAALARTALRELVPAASPSHGRLLNRVRSLLGLETETPAPARAAVEPPAPAPLRCEPADVRELDERVGKLLLSPLSPGLQDLDERLLHQWCALNRRALFAGTPFLFAYEWHVGVFADKAQAEGACQFQGDLILWDGSHTFLAVECKVVKPKHPERERLRQVADQASIARDLLLPYILSRRMAGENATFASARFLQSHDAFRMSRAPFSSEPMPLLTFPKGVLRHLGALESPRLRSCFATNLPAAHGALPSGLLAEQAEQAEAGAEPPALGERRARLAQRSLDAFCGSAVVVVPMMAADPRLLAAAPGRVVAAKIAATPRARAAAAEGGALQQPDAGPQRAAEAAADSPGQPPQPSLDELRRRAVDALRATKGFRLSLSQLAAKVLPEKVPFRDLGYRQEPPSGGQPSTPGVSARKLTFKDFVLSEDPFKLVGKEQVVLKEPFREGGGAWCPAVGPAAAVESGGAAREASA